MDNYLVVNGIKIELTEKQLKALGIEVSNVISFKRAKVGEDYWYIDSMGDVVSFTEDFSGFDTECYNIANYCTDKALMEQRALYETLNRLLWRFSMEHDGNKIDWQNSISSKAYIYYNYTTKMWYVDETLRFRDVGKIYFYTTEIAEQAIEEVIKPFMIKHPEFKW